MKRRKINPDGSFAKWLSYHFGNKPLLQIVRSIADDLLSASNQQEPPIDLTATFSHRKISQLSISKISVDGRLLIGEKGFIIQLKPSVDTRRRFSLAHEIAHTVLYDVNDITPKKMFHGGKPDEEETFCNLLAAELLMPSNMIFKHVKKYTNEPDVNPLQLIRNMAQKFRVSIEAMSRRLIEDLGLLHGILLAGRWLPKPHQINDNNNNYGWRLTWFTASPNIYENLYVPPVNKGPRLKFKEIESVFALRSPRLVTIDYRRIRFGNLKTILENQNIHNPMDIWIYPVISEKVQLFDESDIKIAQDIDLRLRKSCEMLLFFATHE